jgi:[acyl-carrier-protein] S-malonyltransferase
MAFAFLFPGQGSQHVGMGVDVAAGFPEARQVLEEADEALGFSLSTLCSRGPEAELALTGNAQPAILAVSIMVLRVLERRSTLAPAAVAGHSLGEYTALVAAGALELPDALRLVRARGRLMQEAVAPGVGAMAAIAGLDESTVSRLCELAASAEEIVAAANFNGAGQVVLAGHAGAISRAMALAREHGARLVRSLPVSAPFHCALMAPAALGLGTLLADVALSAPTIPVVSSLDGTTVTAPAALRQRLAAQVEQPVRWDRCMEALARQGCDRALELGPGNVLAGLVRRARVGIQARAVGTAAALRQVLEGGLV